MILILIMIIYLFIYLFINQTFLSATYTMTSGQLYIVRNCSNFSRVKPIGIRDLCLVDFFLWLIIVEEWI